MITLFENFDKYHNIKELLSKGKWNTINFLIKSEEDKLKATEFLDKLNIDNNNINEYSLCYTIFTQELSGFRSFELYTSGDGSHMVDGSFSSWNSGLIVSPLMSVDEFINYVNYQLIPSYKPKKIDRTLERSSLVESVENKWYPYRFKTKDEMIKEFGMNWMDSFGDVGWNDNMNYLLGTDYPYDVNIPDLTKIYILLNEVHDNYNNMGWSISPNMLVKNRPKEPSYKPRKIDRTLESNSMKNYYNPITKKSTIWPYRFKTEDEFNKDFIYNRSWGLWEIPVFNFVDNMIYLCGKTLEYDFPENKTSIKIERVWTITKDMITENEIYAPSYKPRKIDKTLESIYGFDDYKYYRAVFKVNNKEENKILQQSLVDLGYGQEIVLDYYPAYIFTSSVIDWHSKRLTYMNKDSLGNESINQYMDKRNEKINPKVFDYNQGKYLEQILKSGNITPSYKPKNFNRRLI